MPAPGTPWSTATAVFTVPNVLTVVRFLGVPLFIWLVLAERQYGAGALVLAIMAGTDWVDGYIARRFNQMSKLGRVMDPIADRLSLIAVAVTLVIAGVVEWWYLAALLVPDAVLLALSLFYFHGHPDLPVSRVGKVRTGLLLVGTPLLVLSKLPVPAADVYADFRVDLPGPGTRGALDCSLQLRLGDHRQGQAAVGRTTAAPADGLACGSAGGTWCLLPGLRRAAPRQCGQSRYGRAGPEHARTASAWRNPRWVFGLLLLCVGMAMNAAALSWPP